MPYLAIDDYKNGLDTRKSPLTTPAGALTRLLNAAVTPGGEIEKRRAFVKVADLAGTKGLASVGNKVVAFSLNEDKVAPDLGMENVSLEFHKLPLTSTTARMMDYDLFDGAIYVTFYDKTPTPPHPKTSGDTLPPGVVTGSIYQLMSDSTYHRWSGKAWQDWKVNYTLPYEPGGREGYTFFHNLANRYYKFTGGVWVTITPKASQATAPDPSGYKEGDTYLNTTDNKTYILKSKAWVKFDADATGDELPPIARDGDTYLNTSTNSTFKFTNSAWVAWSPTAVVAALPAPPVEGEAFLNTADNKTYIWDGKTWNVWTVGPIDYNPHFFDGADPDETPRKYEKTEGSGKGYFVKSYQSKIYSIWGRHVAFSAIKYPKLWVEAPTVPPSGATVVSVLPIQGVQNEFVILPAKKKCYTWTVDKANGTSNWVASDPSTEDLQWIEESTQRTGCGYIDVALQESGGIGLQGLEIYFDKLAILSEQTSQLWSMDPDPNQNALAQVLRNNGTRAPKSVHQYGSGDVLYLNSSGLRSMKARDASNSAAVTDIGSPVDRYILQLGKDNGPLYLKNCKAIIEPVIGRFWAVFPNEILVLSYFPGPAITAWSVYTVPFVIDYVVTAGDHVFVRSGDDLYAFGGKTGVEYDDCFVDIRFPYLDGGKPGHNKSFEALDATVSGAWQAAVSYNFDLQDEEEALGYLTSPTWNKGRFAMQGYASHVSMRFYHHAPGPALLSNAAIHFRVADDEQ